MFLRFKNMQNINISMFKIFSFWRGIRWKGIGKLYQCKFVKPAMRVIYNNKKRQLQTQIKNIQLKTQISSYLIED